MKVLTAASDTRRERHLIIGPTEHGVVRHGVLIATACAHELVRVLDIEQALALDHAGPDIVHIPFTDHLFGATCEAALEAFRRLATDITTAGATISVTLHDVPRGDDALALRRGATYRGVIGAARGVVVNSRLELASIEDDALHVHSLRCIALPIDQVARQRRSPHDRDAVVLGFVFPDRGYEQLIRALPDGSGVLALGRASAGHEDLPARLDEMAAQRGHRWRLSGFVADIDLGARLSAAAVPVAPNPRVTASASIATWIAHGRRPLVPAIDYTREFEARWPGALRLYDPDDVGDLSAAITDALSDPDSTWLENDVVVGPTLAEVANDYRTHLYASAAPRPTVIADRIVVPHNRWDLLPTEPGRKADTVTVVIPYYENQRALDLVLTALTLQTIEHDRLDVVVADDGSARSPDVSAAHGLRARVVRQPRDGFGAAGARNLGAAAGHGEVLAFLDADTVPEPDYLEQLVRIPNSDVDGLSVGRRRHADLVGWHTEDVTAWLTGHAKSPTVLNEPDWLRTAYRDSADLLHADHHSYRHVISAVLAVRRSLFERIGGFDERFHNYGGEDWDFAHRAWLAGALIAHVPLAVAWHDGPEWKERVGIDHRSIKNTETVALTALLPDPQLRGGGQWVPYCRAVIRMRGGCTAAETLATARTAFAAGADCGFWLDGPAAAEIAATLADPRIRAGQPPSDVLARAGVTVNLVAPADLRGLDLLCDLTEQLAMVRTPAMTLRSTRALARCRDADDVDGAMSTVFGRHDRSTPVAEHDVDLAHVLARRALVPRPTGTP